MEKTDWCCWFCGLRLRPKITTVDHKVPLSKGGKNEPDNLVPACKNCNHEKGKLDLESYRLQLAIYKDDGPELTEEQLIWVEAFLEDTDKPTFYGEKL